jgi:DNA-binding NarL/FixJ family response regulator
MSVRTSVVLLDDDPILCTSLRLLITSAPDFYWVGEAAAVEQLTSLYLRVKPQIFLIGGG